MFLGKHRPAGLEFASCLPCNNGARRSDLVAAYIGRCFPDATTDDEIADSLKYLRALAQFMPTALWELKPHRARERHLMTKMDFPEGGALNLGGPIITAHLEAFAARLGFALHFEKTGTIVPPEGGVAVRVFSNVDFLNNRIPEVILEQLSRRSLSAGSWTTENQFFYDVLQADTGAMTMSFAAFRFSFAVLAFAYMDRAKSTAEGPNWVSPGDFAAKPLPSARLGFSVYGARFGWRGWSL